MGRRRPRGRRPGRSPSGRSLPWVRLGSGRRYFETEEGEPFLIIGQNDALTWPELEGLLDRRDLPSVDRHLAWLKAHGVTTLRLMLEYVGDGLYLERPCGSYDPVTVRAVDDLVALCEGHGLRLLLTPFDTFFTWVMWEDHPYNAERGGPCRDRIDLLAHPDGLAAVKARIAFAVERWGGSGTVFAWDLWNELAHHHGVPEEAGSVLPVETLSAIISDLSAHVRGIERRLFGKTHLQTVSHFGPEPAGALADLVFRHPDLDFATTHIYEPGAIDAPVNTLAAADAMARLGAATRCRRPATAGRSPTARPARSTPSRTSASPSPRPSTSPISATWPGPTSPAGRRRRDALAQPPAAHADARDARWRKGSCPTSPA